MVYDVAPYLWHMYRLSIGCVTSCQPFEAINRYCSAQYTPTSVVQTVQSRAMVRLSVQVTVLCCA